MHTIQMHLSQKQKIFSEFFAAFFESSLKTFDAHSLCTKLKNHEKRA